MSLNPRALALQGFLLTPIAMAVHGLLAVDEEKIPPANIGNEPGFNPPISHDRSHKPALLTRRQLRRKRQQDILFLGH